MSDSETTTVYLPEGKESLEFELAATLKNGIRVPVEVVLVYPKGNGLYAVNALTQAMETQTGGMFNELLHRNDASVIQALLENSNDDEDEL